MLHTEARKEWLSVLAKAPANTLSDLCQTVSLPADFEWLRSPEIGSVMTRGRIGSTGSAFNIGEVTVTRCSLKLNDTVVGHGYVQGRDKTHAQQAALIDALMQTDQADAIETAILNPLRDQALVKKADIKRRADQTKVDFFTMARGDY